MACEFLEKCPFFNDKLANMPSTAEILKNTYCKGDFNKCARYMVAKTVGRDKVTLDLFPNDQDKAKKIIEANK